eukprot:gene2986-2150_t
MQQTRSTLQRRKRAAVDEQDFDEAQRLKEALAAPPRP